MDRIKHLQIRFKILLGFAGVCFILVFGTAVGFLATQIFKVMLADMYSAYLVPDQTSSEGLSAGQQLQTLLIQAAIDPPSYAKNSSTLDSLRQSLGRSVTALKTTVQAKETARVADLRKAWEKYDADLNAAIVELKAGRPATAQVNLAAQDWKALQIVFMALDGQLLTSANELYHSSVDNFAWIGPGLVLAGLLGIGMSCAIGIFIAGTISKPVMALQRETRRLASGDVNGASQLAELGRRRDEFGDLARDFDGLQAYLSEVASMTDQISSGNLRVEIQKRGEQDALGLSLAQMVEQLRELVAQARDSSEKVEVSAGALAKAAGQTTEATNQVSGTIQQITHSISQQSQDMNQALAALETTRHAIERVSAGVHNQGRAVEETTHVSAEMNAAIEQVLEVVGTVTHQAESSTQEARQSAGTLRQTIASMQKLGEQIDNLGEKVTAMGERSDEIGIILETIEEIASKTNILAINASIEAAHAEVEARRMIDGLLGKMMISECHMVKGIMSSSGTNQTQQFWADLGTKTGLDMILITDQDGVVITCNDDKLIGWRFPEDPREQAYPFRKLLSQTDGELDRPAQKRSFDTQVFKFSGISRSDQPGIIQVGMNMASIKRFNLELSGFSVVANEVYELAEHARTATREIRDLVRKIQNSIAGANQAMRQSQAEVGKGIDQASRANTSLEQILQSVQDVYQLSQQTQHASKKMQDLSARFNLGIEVFRQVVEANTQATEELTNGFATITRTFESIASISQENSASTEEVSASTEQMTAQMEEVSAAADGLTTLAGELQQSISKFTL